MPKLLPYSSINIKWCTIVCYTVLLCSNVIAQKPLQFLNTTTVPQANGLVIYKDKTSIKRSVRGLGKDNIYESRDKHIGYSVRLENTLKEEQSGSIVTQIANQTGVALYKDIHPFKIKKSGVYEKDFLFESSQLQPGYYVSNISVITERYADTVVYNFGYEPEKIYIKNNPPADLVNYWDQARRELAASPANFSITPRPDLGNKFSDAYEVQFSSTEKAVIFGWLTIPKNNRKNPILYNISDYMSELKPEYRRDVAVLSINTRGTGPSTTNFNYGYYDLGLLNIKDKNKFVFKGIYLDALRGIELINTFASKLGIDNSKVVVGGCGLGASISVIVSSFYPNLKGIILDSPAFIDMRTMINFNEGVANTTFPSLMFKNYYSTKKNTKDALLNTLDYFDPVHFAPYVSCPIIVGWGSKNISSPAIGVYNFFNQLRVSKKDKYVCKNCEANMDKGFYGFKEAWLREKFGQP